MRKNSKRVAILEAALQVVEAKGARHLTIDAVAETSGVSKGGVLYHFASKQALLAGMLEHMIELFQQRIEAPQSQVSALEASLQAREEMPMAERRASQALLAVAAEDTELLAPAREQFSVLFNDAAQQSKDPVEATVLLLANEGLRFLDILDINPLAKKETDAVVSYMHERAGEL